MIVTWTLNELSNGTAFYRRLNTTEFTSFNATRSPIVHTKLNSTDQRSSFIFRATLEGLQPNATYGKTSIFKHYKFRLKIDRDLENSRHFLFRILRSE